MLPLASVKSPQVLTLSSIFIDTLNKKLKSLDKRQVNGICVEVFFVPRWICMLLTVGRLISSGYLGNIPPLGLLLAANFSEICEV